MIENGGFSICQASGTDRPWAVIFAGCLYCRHLALCLLMQHILTVSQTVGWRGVAQRTPSTQMVPQKLSTTYGQIQKVQQTSSDQRTLLTSGGV